MEINVWGLSSYDFGCECRIDVIDDDGKIFNESYCWDHKPTQEEIENAVQVVVQRVNFKKEQEKNYIQVEI